jgi:hypothetical protein
MTESLGLASTCTPRIPPPREPSRPHGCQTSGLRVPINPARITLVSHLSASHFPPRVPAQPPPSLCPSCLCPCFLCAAFLLLDLVPPPHDLLLVRHQEVLRPSRLLQPSQQRPPEPLLCYSQHRPSSRTRAHHQKLHRPPGRRAPASTSPLGAQVKRPLIRGD